MSELKNEWMTFDQAASFFGYKHVSSLRRRLKELRERGKLVDIGKPPSAYGVGDKVPNKVVIFWINSRTPLLGSDAPRRLLDPKRGRRALNSEE